MIKNTLIHELFPPARRTEIHLSRMGQHDVGVKQLVTQLLHLLNAAPHLSRRTAEHSGYATGKIFLKNLSPMRKLSDFHSKIYSFWAYTLETTACTPRQPSATSTNTAAYLMDCKSIGNGTPGAPCAMCTRPALRENIMMSLPFSQILIHPSL